MQRTDVEAGTAICWPSPLYCLVKADVGERAFAEEVAAMLPRFNDRPTIDARRAAMECILRGRYVRAGVAELEATAPLPDPRPLPPTRSATVRLRFPLELAAFIHSVRRFGLDAPRRTVDIELGGFKRSTLYAVIKRLPCDFACLDAPTAPRNHARQGTPRAELADPGPAHLGHPELGPEDLKHAHVAWALEQCGGVRAAAAALGVDRVTIRRYR